MRGRIPNSFIDELLARVDIVDVVERRVPLKKAGREWTACCPFHNERTPSFYVSPAKQFFHCFGCGASGSALKFLMDYERLEFPDAVEELAQSVGVKVPREGGRDETPYEDKSDLYELLDGAARWYQQALPRSAEAQAYCDRRGLDAETIQRFRIGWAPAGYDGILKALGNGNQRRLQWLSEAGMLAASERGSSYDRFRERLMFPILDRRGRVIAFGGRVLQADQTPKYLNSPETPLFHKGRELFALWQVKQANMQLQRIVVVEGYMDVIALHQAGLPIAVATLGTATTSEHTETLFRAASDVVFCFDGDRAGRAAAWKALESTLPRLRDGRQAYFLFLPDGEDPDTLVRKEGKQGFEQRLKDEATPLSAYFYQFLEATADLNTADGRARLRERCKEFIRLIPDGAFRDQMIALLQERTVITPKFLLDVDPTIRAAAMDVFNEKLAATRREMGLHDDETYLPIVPVPRYQLPEYRRTLVRSAMAILLAQPGLADLVEKPYRFATLDKPGVQLLAELLDVVRARPGISTGALLEHFSASAHYSALQKLAVMPVIGDADTQRTEFLDALQRLEQLLATQRREILLARSRESALSADEKTELRELLAARTKKAAAP